MTTVQPTFPQLDLHGYEDYTANDDHLPKAIDPETLTVADHIGAEAYVDLPENSDFSEAVVNVMPFLTKDNLLVFEIEDDEEIEAAVSDSMNGISVKLTDNGNLIEYCSVIHNHDGSYWLWTGLQVK